MGWSEIGGSAKNTGKNIAKNVINKGSGGAGDQPAVTQQGAPML